MYNNYDTTTNNEEKKYIHSNQLYREKLESIKNNDMFKRLSGVESYFDESDESTDDVDAVLISEDIKLEHVPPKDKQLTFTLTIPELEQIIDQRIKMYMESLEDVKVNELDTECCTTQRAETPGSAACCGSRENENRENDHDEYGESTCCNEGMSDDTHKESTCCNEGMSNNEYAEKACCGESEDCSQCEIIDDRHGDRVIPQEDDDSENEKQEVVLYEHIPSFVVEEEEVIMFHILPVLEKMCKHYKVGVYGKKSKSRRLSCVFSSKPKSFAKLVSRENNGFDYSNIPSYGWKKSCPDLILEIRKLAEEKCGIKFDYVLCHIYRGFSTRKVKGKTITEIGSDSLGWHVDKEAMNTPVFSVSLGAQRIFQIKKNDSDEIEDILLKSGDAFHMFGKRGDNPSFRDVYQHQLPPMKIKDIVEWMKMKDMEIPETGKRNHKNLKQIMDGYEIYPTSINLTFRQFE